MTVNPIPGRCALGFLLMLSSGCAGLQGQVEEYGEKGFDAMESASESATKAARRYLCKTARVGAIEQEFPTEAERAALDTICENL